MTNSQTQVAWWPMPSREDQCDGYTGDSPHYRCERPKGHDGRHALRPFRAAAPSSEKGRGS